MALRIQGEFGVTPPHERKPGSDGLPGNPQSGKPDQGDRVEISDTSRRLRANLSEKPVSSDAPNCEAALARKRAAVEERIAGGFYNREEVIHHIARRILDLLRRR
jgi:hypothetical protein